MEEVFPILLMNFAQTSASFLNHKFSGKTLRNFPVPSEQSFQLCPPQGRPSLAFEFSQVHCLVKNITSAIFQRNLTESRVPTTYHG